VKRLISLLARRRWFGLPRALSLALVVVLTGALVMYWPVLFPSARVRAVVEGLRAGSVYVEPGAPGVVDPDRVRKVVGDRPIVVAILNEEPLPASGHINGPDYEFCEDVARLVSTSLVAVFAVDEHGVYESSYCDGAAFPGQGDWGFYVDVVSTAQTAWTYRATPQDRTPEIEEFALAFDVLAAERFPAGIPRRGSVPDQLAWWQGVLAVIGMVAATVALFLSLRLLGGALRRRGTQRAALTHRRAAASTRLSRLADHVLHTERPTDLAEAGRLADAARSYVRLVGRHDEAHDPAELDVVELELADLERELGLAERS
jgi:hypothetical protein